MTHPVLDMIAARRSHRAYAPAPVTDEQLQCLLDAALQSPSAVNRQPWHFTVVRNQQLLREINAEVCARMQRRAAADRSRRFDDPQYDVFYHAPLVIFLSADPNWKYSAMDCGIAVENIALAAEALGLGSVILGMPGHAFEGEKGAYFSQALRFREGEKFMIAIALGTPCDSKEPHPLQPDHVSYVD